MKWRLRIATILLAFATVGCAALGTGTPGPVAPPTTRLASMSFIDSTRGWVVASECPAGADKLVSTACHALIYESVDGGRSWTRISRFLLSPRSVQFVDPMTGWLVGSIGERCGSDLCPNVVMLSQDAGKTWNRVSLVSAALTGAAAASANDAWAVGQSCRSGSNCGAVLVRTTSAGQIWDNADLRLTGSGVFVDRLDLTHGWIGATNGTQEDVSSILATTDGGVNWAIDPTPCRGGTNGLDFTSPLVGWLYCAATAASAQPSGMLFRTTDGGSSWLKVSSVPAEDVTGGLALLPSPTAGAGKSPVAAGSRSAALAFSSPSTGWLARRDGQLLATSDAGQNWRVALDTGQTLLGVRFVDPDHGWLHGMSSIWRTVDGGHSWSKIDVVR